MSGAAAELFALPGIHCAGCIGKIERGLLALPGVEAARVNLSLKRVAVRTQGLAPDAIEAALSNIGFEAHHLDSGRLEESGDDLGRALLIRLALAGFAMMNVMLLSVAVWSGASDATRGMFHLISATIALPVIAYSAQPFFAHAWSALRVGRINMDVPISLAIVLAAGMSLYETLMGGAHAYFDAALSLTFFLLIGRYLDHRTRMAARSAAKELAALEAHTALVRHGENWRTVPVAELVVGARVLIPRGARAAVDGRLQSGVATLDRSFLTGESRAQVVRAGDTIHAGEINQGSPIEIVTTQVGADTTLRRIAALIAQAENGRSTYTALADRAAKIYAPLVHILALLAFIAWVGVSGDVRFALNVAIAVLIITCPCALGLAVPAVATAAIGRLFGAGYLVKHDTALERLAEVDTVVFDKTGTLTLPSAAPAQLSTEDQAIVKALAVASEHPVSQAIAAQLAGVAPADVVEIVEVPGQGVEGIFEGEAVRLGKGALGTEYRRGAGEAVPLVEGETLRDGAAAAVTALRGLGLRVVMMTGDGQAAAARVAAALGIETVHSEVSAEEKHALLRDMAAQGAHVLMIGDGLNDAAALSAAHASIAPASALDVSRSAADIVALKSSFAQLAEVVEVARMTTHLSRQNFAIAALYNLIAVPIALAGLATPLIAALAMSASSVTVLLNALRVRIAR